MACRHEDPAAARNSVNQTVDQPLAGSAATAENCEAAVKGEAPKRAEFGSDKEEEEDIEPPADPPGPRFLWAAQKDLLDEVRCLLAEHPDLIHFKDDDGYTALHRACYSNNADVVLFLLMNHADMNAQTVDGWLPIHSACRWDARDCVDLLLAWGANVNALTNGGQTPLHLAAFFPGSRPTIQQLVLAHSIRTPEPNCQGDAPKDIAMRNSNKSSLFDVFSPHFRNLKQ